ncbi:hypothetical protein [Psychromicrobium xiongbiense]|uniref:hypothetical protein n=1 Tax=Psychromicrobium xiongbiense TaxID=3051184 RepID=UPI002553E1DC|nr:hypothetical protein [Psychromicrobium sp. YIM S02556]
MLRVGLATLAVGALLALPIAAAHASDAPAASPAAVSPAASPMPGAPVSGGTPAPTATPNSPAAATPASGSPAAASPAAKAPTLKQAAAQTATAPSAPVAPPITVNLDQASVQPGETLTGTVDGLDATLPAQATLTRTYPAKPSVTLDCTLSPQTTTPPPAGQKLSCVLPNNQAQGTYDVVVSQNDANGKPRTGASGTVYVVKTSSYDPRISGPTLPIAPGTSTSIKGAGFVPGGDITVSTGSFLLPGGTATADAQGNFDFALTSSPFTNEGQYIVNVTDTLTGVSAQLSIYVLRANAVLNSTINTGTKGGYTTEISGNGFSAGKYTLDLTLYTSDGTTVVSQLAQNVSVNNATLASTSVKIPASTPAGLYQIAATSGSARLAATWIAVFPEPTVTAPIAPATPVIPIIPVTPLPTDPAVKAPEPAPVPLVHQIIGAPNTDPFAQLGKNPLPDLNSSTTTPTGGLVGKDPTPVTPGATPDSSPAPTTQNAPVAAAPSQASNTSEFLWWLLILVALIAIVAGLAGGYFLAAANRSAR